MTVLRSGTVMACVLALLFVMMSAAMAQETLVYYTWAREDSLDDYRPIFEQFEAETGVKVEVHGFGGRVDEYKDAIMINHLAGTGLDVISVSTLWFEELQHQGVFEDLTAWIARDPAMDDHDIFPASLQAWQDGAGSQFALPFDNDIAVLLYNAELFDRYGLPVPDDGWDWDDWLEAGTQLTRDTDGDGLNETFGMMTSWWTSWFSLFWANDGTMFTEDGRSNMKSDAVRDTLQWYAQWFEPQRNLQVNSGDQLAHLGSTTPSAAFANGHIGTMPAGVWAIDYTVETPEGFRFEFGAAPLPKGPGGTRATAIEGQGLAVSVHTADKDVAYRFIQLMATEGQRIGAQAGRFPVTRQDALSEFFLPRWDVRHKNVAIEAATYARSLPRGVMWPVTGGIVNGVNDYLHGRSGLEAVLENVDRELNLKLTELGLID